jgi:hypothetical protein
MRFLYLEQMVSPVVLFGTISLELGQAQHHRIRTTRRQMMRAVIGKRFRGDAATEDATDVGESGGGCEGEERLSFGEWLQGVTREMEERMEEQGLRKWEEEAVRLKWRWAGHALRRSEEKPTLTVLRTINEKRWRAKAGTPRRRWATTFSELLGEEWQKTAVFREEWRRWGEEAVLFTPGCYRLQS